MNIEDLQRLPQTDYGLKMIGRLYRNKRRFDYVNIEPLTSVVSIIPAAYRDIS